MVGLMQRGEIWVTSFNPARGRETGKSRPCLIIQSNQLIAHSETIFALPLTTRAPERTSILRYPLPARDRLRRDCFIMVDHGRALDREKFTDGPLTQLSDDELEAVEHRLLMVLGMG